jgi:predicted enzyme related to lactoylglutathione lyase
MKVGFVILFVKDVARSKEFYTEIVGLPVDETQSSPNFVVLRSEGSLLALENAASLPATQPNQTPGSVEVAFNMDGVDAIYKRWKNAGAEIVLEPEDRPFGRYFVARDPDGHYLDVFGKQ